MGGGPLDQELRALAATLGLEGRIVFTGYRSDERDVLRLLARSRVFCLPTRYDAFPIVFVEAMAMGCPAVGPRMDAVSAIVVDGATGLLVQQDDAAAYAAAIERILDDGALHQRMREAGLTRVREELNPIQMFEDVTVSYDAALRRVA
jgi:rhamnosyl/mannosyltransferase